MRRSSMDGVDFLFVHERSMNCEHYRAVTFHDGRPWQLFVDDGLKPKRFGPNYAFCGGFGPAGGTGGGPRRPPLQIVLPAVMEFLSRVSTKNAADAAATESLAARMAAKEIAEVVGRVLPSFLKILFWMSLRGTFCNSFLKKSIFSLLSLPSKPASLA